MMSGNEHLAKAEALLAKVEAYEEALSHEDVITTPDGASTLANVALAHAIIALGEILKARP
jgi:hypothetical protein